MSDKIDTSAEAVERLARESFTADPATISATLRALVAERKAAYTAGVKAGLEAAGELIPPGNTRSEILALDPDAIACKGVLRECREATQ